MATREQLFNSTVLDVVVPETSLEYPPQTSVDDWLRRLQDANLERKQAFFGECFPCERVSVYLFRAR
jgi:hypothetical protein